MVCISLLQLSTRKVKTNFHVGDQTIELYSTDDNLTLPNFSKLTSTQYHFHCSTYGVKTKGMVQDYFFYMVICMVK